MQNQIDLEIAKLERTAQELIAVKHSLISAGIAQSQSAEQPPVNIEIPKAQPQRQRGRPPGSKNKPKPQPEPPTQAPAEPVSAQPTQAEMFQQAVDATRPEKDKEFEAA